MSQILIRDAESSDIAFVCDSYWRSSKINMETIKKTVAESKIKIACLEESPNVILGFILFNEKPIWAYVKVAFRKMGIYKKLLESTKE